MNASLQHACPFCAGRWASHKVVRSEDRSENQHREKGKPSVRVGRKAKGPLRTVVQTEVRPVATHAPPPARLSRFWLMGVQQLSPKIPFSLSQDIGHQPIRQ